MQAKSTMQINCLHHVYAKSEKRDAEGTFVSGKDHSQNAKRET